jgi:hypothetical protein
MKGAMTDFNAPEWRNTLTSSSPNAGYEGAYCGDLAQAYQFARYDLSPNKNGELCTIENCIYNALPDVTTGVNIHTITDSEGNTTQYCVYADALGRDRLSNALGTDGLSNALGTDGLSNALGTDGLSNAPKTYTITQYDGKDRKANRTEKNMVGHSYLFNQSPLSSDQPNYFEKDCSVFGGCGTCPEVIQDAGGHDCVCDKKEDNEVGWVNKQVALPTTCQIKDGAPVCIEDREGDSSPFASCKKDSECQERWDAIQNADATYLNGDCAEPPQDSYERQAYWPNGEPKHCCGKEWGVDHGDGRCPVMDELDYQQNKLCISYPGTIAYMSRSKDGVMETGKNQCHGVFKDHNAKYIRAGVMCCMPEVPANSDWDTLEKLCTPYKALQQRFPDQKKLYETDLILVGRDGGGHEWSGGNRGYDGCDYKGKEGENTVTDNVVQAMRKGNEKFRKKMMTHA